MNQPRKIAIAGAFGFIGKHLIQHLLDHTDVEIVAISRTPRECEDPRVHCIATDLYSIEGLNEVFEGCDTAIYLVHSMAPTTRLSQGSFEDFDFLLADNFARSAKAANVKQIIYVGGIIPEQSPLSHHLRSRLEVENTLRSYGIPTLSLRCGLVIGPNSSSYDIIVKLIERLPIMILPAWMRTLSSPIGVHDLVRLISKATQLPIKVNKIIDAGMETSVSYKDILLYTAQKMGRHIKVFDVPYLSPALSKLWVTVFSGAHKDLVYPLIDSVKHPMTKCPHQGIPEEWNLKIGGLKEAIDQAFLSTASPCKVRSTTSVKSRKEVRSIQRMPLPRGWRADHVCAVYMEWLPFFLRPFLEVRKTDQTAGYYIRKTDHPLLELKISEQSKGDRRYVNQIDKGLLVKTNSAGTFEFRESPDGMHVFAILNKFRPALPWAIYRSTQAVIHKLVMQRFSAYLRKYIYLEKTD